jgi:regulator of sigma E protease
MQFMTFIIFILVLAVLIFVHELGHFLVARACGIRVDAFAIGFGPKLFSKKVVSAKHGETTYSLNLIPFGGYVKIFGENPDDDSIAGPDAGRSFVNKTKIQQIAVLAAGVFFNFVFAWLVFSFLFVIGFPASIESYPEYSARITNSRVVVTSVGDRTPAALAGLHVGDAISIGTSTTAQAIQDAINAAHTNQGKVTGGAIAINYIRGNEHDVATVTPAMGIVPDRYAIGIEMSEAGTLRLPVYLAIWEGGRYVVHTIALTVEGLYGLIVTAIQGKGSLSSISGPVGIAGLVGDAARLGFIYLLAFTALISINLGVLNLVPFPALDGGRILFVIIETITRRRIKPSVANMINMIGFGLLILLMIVVTFHDIAIRWFVK